MRRPSITKRVVRGLQHVLAVVRAELEAGPEGYFGKSQGFDGNVRDVKTAVAYIDGLVAWFEQDKGAP